MEFQRWILVPLTLSCFCPQTKQGHYRCLFPIHPLFHQHHRQRGEDAAGGIELHRQSSEQTRCAAWRHQGRGCLPESPCQVPNAKSTIPANKGSKQKRVTVYGRVQALPVSTSSGRSLYSP